MDDGAQEGGRACPQRPAMAGEGWPLPTCRPYSQEDRTGYGNFSSLLVPLTEVGGAA